MASPREALHVTIVGRVQGVGFRFFVQAKAAELGLGGWVRNRPDGSVEALGEGPPEALKRWLDQLRLGPPLSRVENVRETWKTSEGSFSSFEIRA